MMIDLSTPTPSKTLNLKLTKSEMVLFMGWECLGINEEALDDHAHLAFRGPLKNNFLAEMWSGSEDCLYLRLIDCCITQL